MSRSDQSPRVSRSPFKPNRLTPVGQLRRPQRNYNLRAIIRRQAEHIVLPRLVSL